MAGQNIDLSKIVHKQVKNTKEGYWLDAILNGTKTEEGRARYEFWKGDLVGTMMTFGEEKERDKCKKLVLVKIVKIWEYKGENTSTDPKKSNALANAIKLMLSWREKELCGNTGYNKDTAFPKYYEFYERLEGEYDTMGSFEFVIMWILNYPTS